ncbi:polysaccharide biosynthesis/export family protein [Acetobacter tropicalis]|uniref:Exopolysaccharide biosynthesis protein n=1 Tax=Acetobacter senegalensis TaxID=446692 RepID=A0A149U2Z7_9PROT|nr:MULTISPECIES: polysaccharide biosynthesis/export family protein [Acetobacter]KXV59727.1 exopolysaccharide biosynthesis protein [Acetobacter senegalensis]MCG4253661.1 polysaccharide export protein [Acetobacter senegalensis]MCG4256421.1 polysaccharide export protein [Acetobacter senegalensis]MCG4266022.1 polysaccharide export protein [Acetobacter senegalensis]MCG4274069.1 polysaccharide export protein [Acetobacter senegalensis]
MATTCSEFYRVAIGRSVCWGVIGSLLAGCTPGWNLKPVTAYDPSDYRLGVDDEIRVMTYGQDQFTSSFRVDSQGKVAFPVAGSLRAEGLTTEEFSDEVRKALQSAQMLRDPKVAVEVSAYRLVSVLGEVAKPGQYPYQPGMTLLTAVAAGGGFTYRALESRAYVARQEGHHTTVGFLKPYDYVKPGDVIKIYERHF